MDSNPSSDAVAAWARIVAERGWAAPGEVESAARDRDVDLPAFSFPVLLVERGILTHAQVVEALTRHAADLTPPDPLRDEHLKAWRYAALAMREGRVSADQVNRGLREMARRDRDGIPTADLGDTLVEPGAGRKEEAAPAREAGTRDGASSLPTIPVEPLSVAATLPESLPAGTASRSDPSASIPRVDRPPTVDGAPTRDYQIVQELGRGGVGVVYKAYHPVLRNHFAVKVLQSGTDASPEAIERFRTEGRALARLRHPGIVAVHDIWEEEGKTYLAMEYLDGDGLERVIPRPGPTGAGGFPAREALRLIAEIADAIQFAHDAGVVHRDLKPENILRERSGRLKVMDFGLAKMVDAGETRLTRTGAVAGTPAYMSPEQVNEGVQAADALSDVYQLGAVLYELLTGRAPYDGQSVTEILLRVADDDPTPPGRWVPGLDRDAETICLKAMARDRGRRYRSARELAEDCRRYRDGDSILARPEAWWEKGARWARRRKLLTALAVVVAVELAVAGAVAWRASRAERERARLEQEWTRGLRTIARTSLRAALLLRRHGGRMGDAEREFLPALEEAVRDAAAQAPELAEPHYHLGRMYRALLQFEAARDAQEQALARDPDFLPSRYERAILASRRYGERLAELRDRWSREEGRRWAAGGLLERGGAGAGAPAEKRPADADLAAADPEASRLAAQVRADLERLERPDADSPQGLDAAMRECAHGLFRLAENAPGGMEEARQRLERALSTDPALEEAYEGLARLEAACDRVEAALAAYDRGLQADPGYVPFRIGRALLLNQTGLARHHRGQEAGEWFGRAIADLDRAVDLAPDSLAALQSRGNIRTNAALHALVRGDDPSALTGAAVADYARVLELAPDAAEAWMGRAGALTNYGVWRHQRGEDPGPQYAQALEDHARALDLQPAWTRIRLHRALLHLDWGLYVAEQGADPVSHFEAALADHRAVLEGDPRRAEAWMERGNLLEQWGRHRADRGEDPEPEFRQALGDYESAGRWSAHPAAIRLRIGNLHAGWALCRQRRGEDPTAHYRDGEQAISRVVEEHPGWTEAWGHLGALQANWALAVKAAGGDPQPRFRAAEQAYDEALRRNPRDPGLRAQRGDLRANWGNHDSSRGADPEPRYRDAQADYDLAVEANPGSVEFRLARGNVLMSRGTHLREARGDGNAWFESALADFQIAVARAPQNAEARSQRAAARMSLALDLRDAGGDPVPALTQAEEDLTEAIRLNPASAGAWLGRATLQANWGGDDQRRGQDPGPRYDRAESDFGEALRRNPGSMEAWIGRANVCANRAAYAASRGETPDPFWARAIAHLDEAIAIRPGSIAARLRRAGLRVQVGLRRRAAGQDPEADFLGALQDLDEALGRDPEHAQARSQRAALRFALGRWADAAQDLESILAGPVDAENRARLSRMLSDARDRLARGAPEPEWLRPFVEAEEHVAAGRRDAARGRYEEFLRRHEAAVAALEADRRPDFEEETRAIVMNAHYNLACLHALAAESDRAFTHLQEAIRHGWRNREHLLGDGDLESLRGDPRWRETLERLTD